MTHRLAAPIVLLIAAIMFGTAGQCGHETVAQPTPLGGTQTVPPPPPPPPTPPGIPSLLDLSSLPVCTTIGKSVTFAGSTWTISPSPQFKILRDGIWISTPRGFDLIVQNGQLYTIAVNAGIYRWMGEGNWLNVGMVEMGCRPPTSPSGKTVLQQNDYLVDAQGGIWTSSCSYYIFATYCPDFAGSTIEEGIILRNGTRFPDPGIRSIAEPNNAPWNLKWCGGQMYVHLYPTPGTFGRYQGATNPLNLAPATATDCGG